MGVRSIALAARFREAQLDVGRPHLGEGVDPLRVPVRDRLGAVAAVLRDGLDLDVGREPERAEVAAHEVALAALTAALPAVDRVVDEPGPEGVARAEPGLDRLDALRRPGLAVDELQVAVVAVLALEPGDDRRLVEVHAEVPTHRLVLRWLRPGDREQDRL